MKKMLISTFLVSLISFSHISAKVLTIDSMPESVEEFLQLKSSLGETAETYGALEVVALIKYSEDKDLAKKMLAQIYCDRYTEEGYENDRVLTRMKERDIEWKYKDYVFRSYIAGTSPVNNYDLPALPWKMYFKRNAYSENAQRIKPFVKSSGADSPRPFSVRKTPNGLCMDNDSSLFVGVRKL